MTARRQKSLILSVADDITTAAMVDKYLGITTHKTGAVKFDFTSRREKTILAKQMELYNLSLKDNLYKYVQKSKFKNKINDVKVEANQLISNGQIIKTLCGQTAPIRPQDIQTGINDFSLILSGKSNKELIFLGPAAFINYCCSANSKWVANGEAIVCAQAIKPIQKGEEITADYGKDFFGDNNVECECDCCQKKNEENIPEVAKETNTYDKEVQDSASTSKESHAVTDTGLPQYIPPFAKKTNTYDKEVHVDSHSTSDSTSYSTSDSSSSEEILSVSDTEMCLVPQFPCTVCNKSFTYLSWMKKHLQTHNKVECTICFKLLSSSESLKRHMALHKKKRKRKHKCQTCSCKYYQASDLLYHIKTTHLQSEKVKCTHSEKLYKTEKLMKAHVNEVHMQLQKFKCLYCGQSFGSSITLFRHKNKEHTEP